MEQHHFPHFSEQKKHEGKETQQAFDFKRFFFQGSNYNETGRTRDLSSEAFFSWKKSHGDLEA